MSQIEQLHQQAMRLYEEKDLEGALRIYEDIIKKYNPADEVALSCAMDIYLELDDKVNYYLARANVNIAQHKFEYAINDTKKALELDIDNIETRRKLARLYKVNNNTLKAIDEFLKILSTDENDKDCYFELVDLYMKEDSPQSAIDIGVRAHNKFPEDKNISNMLAQLYFKQNEYKLALEVVDDELLKIKILLQDEQNEKAKESLDKVDFSKLDNLQKTSYHILKAQYCYNTGDYDEALRETDEFIKLSKPNPISFQMKALIYEEKKDMFKSHLNWGFCYKTQGKFDDAIVEFENAYRENEKDKTTLIELANLYMQNKERYVAMEYWQKVYDIDKDNQAREILAEFYYSEGDFEKAREFGKVSEKKEIKQEENYTGFLDKLMDMFSRK